MFSQILSVSLNKYRGHKIKVGGGCRNDFCFKIKEINFLVVGLFHNFAQPLVIIFVIPIFWPLAISQWSRFSFILIFYQLGLHKLCPA